MVKIKSMITHIQTPSHTVIQASVEIVSRIASRPLYNYTDEEMKEAAAESIALEKRLSRKPYVLPPYQYIKKVCRNDKKKMINMIGSILRSQVVPTIEAGFQEMQNETLKTIV